MRIKLYIKIILFEKNVIKFLFTKNVNLLTVVHNSPNG